MVKFKISKDDYEKLPEAIKAEYKGHTDGNYYLEVEGAVAKERLDEFRTNNTELLKKLEPFKDVNVDEYIKALATQKKLDEKKLLEAGEVEKVVDQRVGAMKTDFETKLADRDRKLEGANRQLDVLIIDNSVREHAIKTGIAPSAVDDVLLRARSVYRVEDGKAVPKDANGATIFGKDGSNPLQIADWIGGLKETAPHLFQPSKGSGAGGGDNTNGNRNVNTNASPQSKIADGLRAGNSSIVS